ncbi:MAG: ribbon-helix-helix protein, CopG family [Dermatophilaceae bacterium]
MAMTLRLTENETESLRTQAESEGRSMQDVARAAVREYIDRHMLRRDVDAALDVLTPRYAEVLRRLGE